MCIRDSYGITRRLPAAYDAAGGNSSDSAGAGVVLGLPAGSRHELGLLSFATAARRLGLPTTYLGADVPISAWKAAVSAKPVACAVLAVSADVGAEALAETVAAIKDARPSTLVAVGGGAQDSAPPDCLRLGHQVGPAAALLAERLGSLATSRATT